MPTPRLKPWLVFQWAFAAIVVWFAGRALAGQWDQIAAAFSDLTPKWSLIAAATLVVLVAYAVQIEAWRRVLAIWAIPLSPASAATVWFAANLGKYVPGKIWSIAALSGMARDHGSSAVAAGASSLVMQVVAVATGITIATLLGASATGTDTLTIALMIAGLALFALLGPVLVPPAVRLASRLSGRALGDATLPPRAILIATIGTSLGWILGGIAFHIFANAVLPTTFGPTTSYISANAAASVAGFVALFAPAGVGVRELALVGTMTQLGLASAPEAAVIALMSRVWLTFLDLGPGLAALAVSRSIRKRELTK